MTPISHNASSQSMCKRMKEVHTEKKNGDIGSPWEKAFKMPAVGFAGLAIHPTFGLYTNPYTVVLNFFLCLRSP